MKKQLTPDQLDQLKPFEQNMAQAAVIGSLRYPGASALEMLRKTWADLTGTTYPFREGCAECIVNLLRDLGLVYFAQLGVEPGSVLPKVTYYYNEKTDRLETRKPEAPKAAEKPAPAASPASKAPKATTTAKKSTSASKAPKTAKK